MGWISSVPHKCRPPYVLITVPAVFLYKGFMGFFL